MQAYRLIYPFWTSARHSMQYPIEKCYINWTNTWLGNFLTKWKMRVVLEGEVSEEVSVDSGVPKGTVLSPLPFLCHMNDLPDSMKSTARLFADDCLLYREIRPTVWPQTAGRMDQAIRDALQSTKVPHPLNKKQIPVLLQSRWGHLQTSATESVPRSSNCSWPQVDSPYLLCLQEGRIYPGVSTPQSPNCSQECCRTAYIAPNRLILEAEHQQTGTHPKPSSPLYHQRL